MKISIKCVIQGTASQRIRVKLTAMTVDATTTSSKVDGACGTSGDTDRLYVYLYGTDVDAYP